MNSEQIRLIMKPGQPSISWKTFDEETGPYSIAVDGYVHGKTRFYPTKIKANFDHHAHSNPIAVHATCGQIYNALLRGFYDVFRGDDGSPRVDVYTNHNDPDVAMCWTLINHGYKRDFLFNDLLHKIATREDCIDSTAGAIPFEQKTIRKMAWVFEPYTLFRSRGMLDLETKDPATWSAVIYEIEERILEYVAGRAQETDMDMSYEPFLTKDDFIVAKEIGTHPKTGIFRNGYKIYVLFRERPNGRYSYVIGILSVYYAYINMRLLARKLNEIENFVDPSDRWGGGNSIIGSGWLYGSSLSPGEVANIVKDALNKKHKNCMKKTA